MDRSMDGGGDSDAVAVVGRAGRGGGGAGGRGGSRAGGRGGRGLARSKSMNPRDTRARPTPNPAGAHPQRKSSWGQSDTAWETR